MKNNKNENEVLKRFKVDLAHFDAHMHLAWIDDLVGFAEQLEKRGMSAFGVTVSPREFLFLLEIGARHKFLASSEPQNAHVWHQFTQHQFAHRSAILALGLHPWFVDEISISEFEKLARETLFIGEVGLDFKNRRAKDKDLQIRGFEAVCESVQPNSVISIHSVGTKGKTHEILKRSGRLKDCLCIYHWFSDDSKTLTKAIEDGCYFSVNKKMILSARGREYLKVIPSGRLLIETDAPSFDGDAYSFADFDNVLEKLDILRGQGMSGTNLHL